MNAARKAVMLAGVGLATMFAVRSSTGRSSAGEANVNLGPDEPTIDTPLAPQSIANPIRSQKNAGAHQHRSSDTASTAERPAPLVTAGPAPTATHEENMARVAERWEGETDDPAWTDELARYLDEVFVEEGIAAGASEVHCRTTVCRVHLRFDSLQDAATLFDLATVPHQELLFSTPNPDDENHEVTVLLVRPGSSPDEMLTQ